MDPTMITGMIAAIPGIVASVIGGLVLRNQKLQDERHDNLKRQVDKHDDSIKQIASDLNSKDAEVARNYVGNEAFLRETGFTRRAIEQLTMAVSRLDGKLTVSENLPQICGNIAREIAREMKGGPR